MTLGPSAPQPAGGPSGSAEGWQPPTDWVAPGPDATLPPGAGWAPPDPATLTAWPAPVGPVETAVAAPPTRRLPTALKVLLVGFVSLAVVIGLVWAGGGFEERESLTDAQIGEPLDLGPVEVIVQEAVRFDKFGTQMIEVIGTCRSTEESSSSLSVLTISDMALAGLRGSDDQIYLSDDTQLTVGTVDTEGTVMREYLAPGMPAIPCVFEFEMPDETQFTDEIVFFVWKLVHVEQGNVKNDAETSKVWAQGPDGYRVEMPVTLVRR